MKTFRTYLMNRRQTRNPSGEIARQLRDDPQMEQIESWPQLQAYIYRKAHPDKVEEIIQATEPVWKSYRSFVLKDRRSK
jgi:hypothetical protein